MAGENQRIDCGDGIPAGFSELLDIAGRMPPIVPKRVESSSGESGLSVEERESVDFGIGCGEEGRRIVNEAFKEQNKDCSKPRAELFVESIDLNDSAKEISIPPCEAILVGVRGEF